MSSTPAIARAAYAAEIRATEQLIDLESQQLQLTEVQVRAGTAPYSSVLSVRSLIAANQALLAPLRQKVSQAEDLLATLEGVVPSKATLPEIELTALALPVDLPVSLPVRLGAPAPRHPVGRGAAARRQRQHRRRDGRHVSQLQPERHLRRLRHQLRQPFGGTAEDSGASARRPPSPCFKGAPCGTAGRRRSTPFSSRRPTIAQTVLSAFAQVADSLKALEHDAEALQAQVDARRAAGEALVLLQANYHAGLVAYPDVLAADVQLHQATIAYLQAVAQRHQDTVALFVALGGGWWNAKQHGGRRRGAMKYKGHPADRLQAAGQRQGQVLGPADRDHLRRVPDDADDRDVRRHPGPRLFHRNQYRRRDVGHGPCRQHGHQRDPHARLPSGRGAQHGRSPLRGAALHGRRAGQARGRNLPVGQCRRPGRRQPVWPPRDRAGQD